MQRQPQASNYHSLALILIRLETKGITSKEISKLSMRQKIAF